MQRTDLASGDACQAMNGYGKIVPRANAFVAEMIDAGNDSLTDSGENGTSQIAGIGRSTNLVEHNSERLTFTTQADHSLYEIVAIDGVQPCRTDNHGTAAFPHSFLLACQLRYTIYRIGARLHFFRIGDVPRTVEHIVGRHLYQCCSTSFGSFGQVAGSQMIEFIAQFAIVFSLIHGRISGTIHNHVDCMIAYKGTHSLLVADVQFLHVGKEIGILLVFGGQNPHLIAKLTVGTGY